MVWYIFKVANVGSGCPSQGLMLQMRNYYTAQSIKTRPQHRELHALLFAWVGFFNVPC